MSDTDITHISDSNRWDTLISGALVFDGLGGEPQSIDIAIKDGRIAAKGAGLPTALADEVVDASGLWLTPGLLDIHTHLDLEVEVEPGLPEAVRHGTTTVIFGNCSLGLCFGKQQENGQDPIVDCFTRVENVPKRVLSKCVEAVTWDNPRDYLDHFAKLPLGPNIATFVPHSMLRIEAMGLQNSVTREPTEAELASMESTMRECMDLGYLGMSTDGLPFHYLANEPNIDKRIPTQHAKFSEYRRLLDVVRDRDGVWQTTAIIENKLKMFGYYALTSGRLFGKPLKTSALAALDFIQMPRTWNLISRFTRLMNSVVFNGKLQFQALGTKFRMWSDGVVSPIYEELDSTCRMIGTEVEDREARQALLADPEFIEQFRSDWYVGRRGWNLPRLLTKLGVPDKTAVRELHLMTLTEAACELWCGETLQQVYLRLIRFQAGDSAAARNPEEAGEFAKFAKIDTQSDVAEADFFLELLRHYDYGFRFYYDVANLNQERVLELLLDDITIPGFNDSGAHLTNMAFFDGNLMSLKLALEKSQQLFSRMVKRLTSEPAEFFGLDTGSLDIGAKADIAIFDPEKLLQHDDESTRVFEYRDIFEHRQLLSRSDGVVPYVFINGRCVWQNDQLQECLGKETLGVALRAKSAVEEKPAAASSGDQAAA